MSIFDKTIKTRQETNFKSVSKIDCSKTENFFKVKERMTKGCTISCCTCLLDNALGEERSVPCSYAELHYPEKVVEIVQKWSDEHPQKTRLDDFMEKYPKALLRKDGTPVEVCCENLGYTKVCIYNYCDGCSECWNAPLEREE